MTTSQQHPCRSTPATRHQSCACKFWRIRGGRNGVTSAKATDQGQMCLRTAEVRLAVRESEGRWAPACRNKRQRFSPGEFERSFQRILDARENRCHHRTTGLMLSQMQELVRQVHNALTEQWNKGVVAQNRMGCTERPRSHVFSAELFAGVSCGAWWRSSCRLWPRPSTWSRVEC